MTKQRCKEWNERNKEKKAQNDFFRCFDSIAIEMRGEKETIVWLRFNVRIRQRLMRPKPRRPDETEFILDACVRCACVFCVVKMQEKSIINHLK